MDTSTFMDADSHIILRLLYGLTFFISITGYSFLSYRSIVKYQRELKNQAAYTNAEITLNWLKGITILFFTAYCMMFVAGGIQVFSQTSTFSPMFITYFGLTFFAFLISFYGIRQPVLFGFVVDDRKPDTGRYERSGLNDYDTEEYREKPKNYIKKEKPYLNPELTMYQLAQEVEISRHHLTQAINEKLNKNFYTFVNEYRLEEFKERLINPEYKNLKMLAVAFDSGFNSKSTFNDFFKKTTGQTPSQYKKSLVTSST
jgi:AraC-like DNA-binding protein